VPGTHNASVSTPRSPEAPKRLGVLGTLVWDRIWRRVTAVAGAEPMEGWGGIAYSLGAVAAARPEGWEVVPLLKLGEDRAEQAEQFLQSVPGLRLESGVQAVPHPTNHVELRYHDEARRCERLSGGVPPWHWEELAPLLQGLDGLYVNFISGFEMELSEAERLRAGFGGPIYADLHSLFLARDSDGRRSPRPLPEWQRWLRCFDAVQLNEDELATLADGRVDPWHFAASAMSEEAPLILVTLGAAGAGFVVEAGFPADPLRWPEHRRNGRRRDAPVSTRRVAPEGGPWSGDPTGCGDVWGSTLFARLLGGSPLEEAIRSANSAGARKLSHSGISGLYGHLAAEPHRG
jgi:hypothetical protein